jgi:hypothetical protein
MKRSIKIFSLLLLFANGVLASGPGEELASEKSKNYSKTYAVGSSDKILLDNKFGDIKISTWAKNEIKVDVNITVKARTDERAQKLLDVISIEDSKAGSDISFKTFTGDKKHKETGSDDDDDDGDAKHKDDNTSFRINYTVYLPANATLSANDMFGDIVIGDYDGVLTVNSRFGSLTAGKLSQPKKVSVQFGRKLSVIESIDGGKVDIQFSQALINRLSGEITANFTQSHGVKIRLDNNLKKLDVNNSFSEILIDAPKNLSASFKIKISFGDFSNQSTFAVNKTRDDDDSYSFHDFSYSGKSGAGTTPITIKSSFGKITLGHDLSFDAAAFGKGKDKDKNKSKV